MDAVIDAVVEIFAWAGFGLAIVFGVVALVLLILDGTWVPVRAAVERERSGGVERLVARWFDDDAGGVGEARLSAAEHAALGGGDLVDVYVRRGWVNRMRSTPSSPAVRVTGFLALGLAGVGVLSVVTSWILLFARG